MIIGFGETQQAQRLTVPRLSNDLDERKQIPVGQSHGISGPCPTFGPAVMDMGLQKGEGFSSKR
jgi:hypothetical protein